MDKYDQYIQILTSPAPGLPAAMAFGAEGDSVPVSETGEFTIDKTFAELEALYFKGALSRLTYHRGDGSKVLMHLAYVGELEGKRAFVFSVAPSSQTDYGFQSFALNEDDVLTYGDAFVCDAMLVPAEGSNA